MPGLLLLDKSGRNAVKVLKLRRRKLDLILEHMGRWLQSVGLDVTLEEEEDSDDEKCFVPDDDWNDPDDEDFIWSPKYDDPYATSNDSNPRRSRPETPPKSASFSDARAATCAQSRRHGRCCRGHEICRC